MRRFVKLHDATGKNRLKQVVRQRSLMRLFEMKIWRQLRDSSKIFPLLYTCMMRLGAIYGVSFIQVEINSLKIMILRHRIIYLIVSLFLDSRKGAEKKSKRYF
jgi:hypothetical protein